jgi:hypothetical protein
VIKVKKIHSFLPTLFALSIFTLGAWYAYSTYYSPKKSSINIVEAAMCRRDVFTCPDGSSVPRSGANCEFVCPGHVTLEVSPRPTSAYVGDEISLDLNAIFDTGNISGIELHMSYNPSLISVLSFAPTQYLPTVLTAPTYAGGSISTTLGAPVDSGGRTTWGTIAKFKIKPLYPGLQTIIYESNTVITSLESGGNALKSAPPIQFKVYYPGDLNKDEAVDMYDYNELTAKYGDPYTIYDYNNLVANYKREYPHQMSKR